MKKEENTVIFAEKKKKNTSKFRNFYPDYIFEKVEDITYELLNVNNIKLVLLDMDNTLIDTKCNYSKELKKWTKDMKLKGIKPIIVSNSISNKKVSKVAKELGMQYYFKASKPSLKSFKKVSEDYPDIKKSEILMVGDQLFTDVWGGNRFGVYTALVKRINKKEHIVTSVKRPLEKIVLKKYYKKVGNEKECKVY